MEELKARIEHLERMRRRDRYFLWAVLTALCAVLLLGAQSPRQDDLRVRTLTADQIVVLDDQGQARVRIGEDPEDTQRRSRACGLTLYDQGGAERAGWSTFEDRSVVLALDAPAGVGAPMRDRIGLVVGPDGSARVDLINNSTEIPVRLVSEADGTGGVEFYEYDLEAREATVTRLSSAGSTTRVVKLDGGG